MLDSLRSAAQSWVAKLLLGLLVLSFAIWGISDVFRGGLSGNAALTAGGSEVSATDYRFAYEQQMMRLSQQFRQRLTREQAKTLGVENRLLLDFTAGYGFVGIAVALMGRGHPLGVVLAALLFGALYQGGAELAFDEPKITRDMIVVIQGLVVLFAGAFGETFRAPLSRLFAAPMRGKA